LKSTQLVAAFKYYQTILRWVSTIFIKLKNLCCFYQFLFIKSNYELFESKFSSLLVLSLGIKLYTIKAYQPHPYLLISIVYPHFSVQNNIYTFGFFSLSQHLDILFIFRHFIMKSNYKIFLFCCFYSRRVALPKEQSFLF